MAAVANGVKNRLRGDRPSDFLSWGPEFPLCSRSAGGENMHVHWSTCLAPFENLSINPRRYQILWNYKKGKHFLNQHSEICDIWNHFLHWSRYWKISPWHWRETTQLCIVTPPSDRQSTTCKSINNWSPAICSTFTWGGTLSPGSEYGSVSWSTRVNLS